MRMLRTNPAAAYKQIDVDARIQGARPDELVGYCFEQATRELDRSVRAHKANDRTARSDGLTRALSAVTALEMGLDRDNPASGAMLHFYGSARETMLGSVGVFNVQQLRVLSADLTEIGQALTAAATNQDVH